MELIRPKHCEGSTLLSASLSLPSFPPVSHCVPFPSWPLKSSYGSGRRCKFPSSFSAEAHTTLRLIHLKLLRWSLMITVTDNCLPENRPQLIAFTTSANYNKKTHLSQRFQTQMVTKVKGALVQKSAGGLHISNIKILSP